MSMKVFSLSSMRKMALALLIVVNFLTGYKLNIMMVVRHLISVGNAVVLRHLPSLCPLMQVWTVSIDSNLSLWLVKLWSSKPSSPSTSSMSWASIVNSFLLTQQHLHRIPLLKAHKLQVGHLTIYPILYPQNNLE